VARGGAQIARRRWRPVLIGVTGAIAVSAIGIGAALGFNGGSSPPPPLTGVSVDRPVPMLPLRNERGGQTSLSAFRGRIVVLTPFLTLCHEVCPLTTGAFQTIQRDLDRAGLAGKVVLAEVSVDPWRDTASRLRAFARTTGTRLRLFTGSAAQLARFWRFFGVAYRRTGEGTPPDTDWLTGRPLTFDVDHTDGLFLVDAAGRERIVDVGMPHLRTDLPRALSRLLNAEGHSDLIHPRPGWTVEQALDDVEHLLGHPIPTGRVG
jgi:cytochrome oxidase Cu insertion factor (SCO1/SenC/PrrC family)